MARATRTAAAERSPARPDKERPPRDDKYFSKVIGKALDVISILRSSAQPLTLNELTLRLELAKSSVFRILHTLEVAEYVERDPARRYTLAPHLRPWGPGQLRQLLVQVSLPRMKELSRQFCETVSLAMRFDNRIEVVATVESSHRIRMGNTIGRILPPHASSLGKAITAGQPEDVREHLIRSYGIHRFTEHTNTDEIKLKRELERVRSRGYSTDLEESVLEGWCFGAPISGRHDEVFAAISVSSPKMRLQDERVRENLTAALRRTAAAISQDLKARTPFPR